jgi:hypothetical protein
MQCNYYYDCEVRLFYSGCSVTANIPVLGTGDSGFESRHPDNKNNPR